jgi:hypothetical protein
MRVERDHEDRRDDERDAENRDAEPKQRVAAPAANRDRVYGDVYNPVNGRHASSESDAKGGLQAWREAAEGKLENTRTVFEQAGLVFR